VCGLVIIFERCPYGSWKEEIIYRKSKSNTFIFGIHHFGMNGCIAPLKADHN
jgi:hypothetical protein